MSICVCVHEKSRYTLYMYIIHTYVKHAFNAYTWNTYMKHILHVYSIHMCQIYLICTCGACMNTCILRVNSTHTHVRHMLDMYVLTCIEYIYIQQYIHN